MRDLTKDEKKLFDVFIKGYVEGLKGVPTAVLMKFNTSKEVFKYTQNDVISPVPEDGDILESFKETIKFWNRNRNTRREYKQGYLDGYFQMLSSEQPRVFLDPELNEDIYKYLKSVWLHNHVYGGGSDAGESVQNGAER